MKRLICVLLCLLLFTGCETRETFRFDAGYTLEKSENSYRIKISAINLGNTVHYEGSLADNLSSAQLLQNGQTVAVSIKMDPSKDRNEPTVDYYCNLYVTYTFPGDVPPGDYQLVFYFCEKPITLNRVVIE